MLRETLWIFCPASLSGGKRPGAGALGAADQRTVGAGDQALARREGWKRGLGEFCGSFGRPAAALNALRSAMIALRQVWTRCGRQGTLCGVQRTRCGNVGRPAGAPNAWREPLNALRELWTRRRDFGTLGGNVGRFAAGGKASHPGGLVRWNSGGTGQRAATEPQMQRGHPGPPGSKSRHPRRRA
jgi:hypothetical protein